MTSFIAVTSEYDSLRSTHVAHIMGPAVIAEQFELVRIEQDAIASLNGEESELYWRQQIEDAATASKPSSTEEFISELVDHDNDFDDEVAGLHAPEPYHDLLVRAGTLLFVRFNSHQRIDTTTLYLALTDSGSAYAHKERRYASNDLLHTIKEPEDVTGDDWELLRHMVGQIETANTRLRGSQAS